MARQFLSSQGIATAEAFLSANTATTANALMDWRKQWESREYSMASAQACIYQWKHRLRQLQPSIPREPLIEQDAELQNLSPMARQFLSSQGIATAEAFLSGHFDILAALDKAITKPVSPLVIVCSLDGPKRREWSIFGRLLHGRRSTASCIESEGYYRFCGSNLTNDTSLL
jgi:hypothetical protein